MRARIAVTGFGVLTAFGFGAAPIRAYIFEGQPGFRRITRFDPAPYRCAYGGQSDWTGSQVDAVLRCGAEAVKMAGLGDRTEAATFLGTSGDHVPVSHFWETRSGDRVDVPTEILQTVPSFQVDALAEAIGAHGPRLAFTNGCVASSNAIAYGCELIASGRQEVAICGGSYLLEEEFFAMFHAGRALSREPALRAFSAQRSGLLLGDGVAVIVLEEMRRAEQREAFCLGEIAGWGIASDAYHVCRPHPHGDGLAMAMRKAMRTAQLTAGNLDYINAHGTGTQLNDVSETRAIWQACGERAIDLPITSTKSMTGHTLEGAGAVEAVITLMALQAGFVPPTAGYIDPDPQCDLDYVPNRGKPADLHYAMTLNSAFGGVNSALVLKRI